MKGTSDTLSLIIAGFLLSLLLVFFFSFYFKSYFYISPLQNWLYAYRSNLDGVNKNKTKQQSE